ncbi:class V lanthionine synthetase subunit LxmK [Streptomyces sp. URMC 123]|uniref:class V lanthionine synthetase subunit LxmK n=1 Tax=Streptomyces sp. URMC 123 TaxID=3423403 RepID=UPI003F1B7252
MTRTSAPAEAPAESAVEIPGEDPVKDPAEAPGGTAPGSPTLLRFRPVELAAAPEVEALLERLGLGPFDRSTLTALPGRNDTWAGTTRSGAPVFVKRLTGPADDVRRRMRRTLAFEHTVAAAPAGTLRGPRLLGSDEDAGLLAFDYLEGARSGIELMLDREFTPELARTAGEALGLLHGTRVGSEPAGPADRGDDAPAAAADRGPELDRVPPPFPSLDLFEALPLEMYEESSSAELETWRLMQGDEPLMEAVAALLDAERRAPKVPAHCDLRMDQFLLVGEAGRERLLVADWEEFRLADAARDIGGFAGEWLHRSVLDIVASRGDRDADALAEAGMSRETVLARGRDNLLRLRPVIEAFWAGYRHTRPDADPDLARRATAFAGWHTLDRLVAQAARGNYLRGIDRAAAGIGRTALLDPARFTTTLGLGETS